jgi:CheY-like chemotaxis protein
LAAKGGSTVGVAKAATAEIGFLPIPPKCATAILNQNYSNCYDFLIIAHVMPRTNGPELIKRIRNEGLSIPIILTTGWTKVPIALEAMKSGADDLFIKPLSPEMLTSSFESVLKQRSLQIKNRNLNPQICTGLKVEDISHTQNHNLRGLIRDYYETGELMAVSTYNEEKFHGVSKVYRKYGSLLFEGSFRNGFADGRSKWFTDKGQVYIEEDYKNGDCLQRINYDSTGKVRQVFQYRT